MHLPPNPHPLNVHTSAFTSLSACVMMKALSLHPYYKKRGQCEFTLTSLRLWPKRHSVIEREKWEPTCKRRERRKEGSDSSLWRAISIKAALSPTASYCWCELKESVNQLSLVCVRLPFSELWRRGGKEERAVQHISQKEAWSYVLLSPEYQKKKKNPHSLREKRHRMEVEGSPIPFIGDCVAYVVTKTLDTIDFQRTGYGEPYFSTLLFQVFAWRAGIEILPLVQYFQHTRRASSAAVEYMFTPNHVSYTSVFHFPHLINLFFIQHDLYFELVFHSSLQDLPSIFTFDFFPLKLLQFLLLCCIGER